MGLITVEPVLIPADNFNEDTINDRYQPVVAEINGNLDNANIKTGAAIGAAKIADTAAVLGNTVDPGTQTFTRPTEFTGGALRQDTSTSNRSSFTPGAEITGGGTLALSDATKAVQNVVFTAALITQANVIGKISGGVVDQVYHLWANNQDATFGVTFNHTQADATDNIKFKLKTNFAMGTNQSWYLGTFLYGDMNGSGFNQWWEI